MVWKFNSDRPVYLQIITQLQAAVLTGQIAPGDRLPSVRDLAAQARVNPNTVQHALQELEHGGLLVTQGTSGRFVTEDAQIIEQTRQSVLNELCSQCLKMFALHGVQPEQAVEFLDDYSKRR